MQTIKITWLKPWDLSYTRQSIVPPPRHSQPALPG